MMSIPLSRDRRARAKWAYTTRLVRPETADHLDAGDVAPAAGDLVLASVESIGHHTRLELVSGRKSALFVGDEVVVAYADRYAPDQFEATVPDDLGRCDLVAAGGVAALCRSRHAATRIATGLAPIGLLADGEGRRVNLADWGRGARSTPSRRPPTICVVGTAMNAGKTTTAADLVRAGVERGARVGAAKVTGTGAGGDAWLLGDAGASPVLDIVDAGLASTYGASSETVQRAFAALTGELAASGVDVAVLEVADGLLQQETAELVTSRAFRRTVDAVVFAAGDALGASGGVDWLRRRSVPVVAVAGRLTASPLAVEEADRATGLPVLTREALRSGELLARLVRSPAHLVA